MPRDRESVGGVGCSVRPYEPDDAAALADVMWRSVRSAALADYSVEQTEAWLPVRRSPEAMHRWADDGRSVFVATLGEYGVVGYTDLEADGHIDHLYCVPEAVGSGTAAALYDALERRAHELGLGQLHVEASESAKRFFEKRGFIVNERRDWELRDVPIHNYAMSKVIQVRHQAPHAPGQNGSGENPGTSRRRREPDQCRGCIGNVPRLPSEDERGRLRP